MSPRAAWRLERLGFTDVHDYAAGKVDWMAAELPTVRADMTQRRALDIADRDPLTCAPDTQLRVAAQHAAEARQRSVVVLNDAGSCSVALVRMSSTVPPTFPSKT